MCDVEERGRTAMKDNVCTEVDGLVVDRGSEGGVDAANRLVLLAQSSNLDRVDNASEWIGDLLAEEKSRALRFQDFLKCLNISGVDHCKSDPHFRENSSNKLSCPAVAVCGCNNMSVLIHEGQQHSCD